MSAEPASQPAGADGRAQRGVAGAGLPCPSYNNCIENDRHGEVVVDQSQYAEGYKIPVEEDQSRRNAGRRLAFQAVGLVGDFVQYWGHEHVAMWTLTPCGNHMPTPKEFARNWHSLRTNELGWAKGYLRFLEPQQRGAPHYHVLVAVAWDLKPSEFNWAAFNETCQLRCKSSKAYLETREQYAARRKTAGWRVARAAYVESAAEETRAMWKRLRDVLPKYGFGRSEFLPLRDTTGAAVYTGGYLRAGVQHRFGAWKGVRLIEADRVSSNLWRNHGRQFMFNQCAERIWRHQLGVWAKMVGCADSDEISARFGPRWCFHHRDRIMQIDAPDIEFTAVNQDGKPLPRVNLREYQHFGRVKHAAAFAAANGWTYGEAWNYLYQRGTVFDCTPFTNPALREEVILTDAQDRRFKRLDNELPCDVYVDWKETKEAGAA